jgi:DNA-binding MarR family transcriptional regulator
MKDDPLSSSSKKFTPVFLNIRRKLSLSWIEYELGNNICSMQKKNDDCWCRASQGYFARLFGVDKYTILKHEKRMIDDGYLERTKDPKYKDSRIKATIKWIEFVDNHRRGVIAEIYWYQYPKNTGIDTPNYPTLDAT